MKKQLLNTALLLVTAGVVNAQVSFAPHVTYGIGTNPLSVFSADFNGDGNLDLATASNFGNNVSILLGSSTGTFTPAVNYGAGAGAYSVISADFNGDGNLDLATANFLGNNVSVLLGSGTGTFAPAVNYGAGTAPISLYSADFNGDGNLDLTTANSNGNNVSILLGSGAGTFAPAVNYGAASNPISLYSADFNNDGNLDLAAAAGSNNVSVLLGSGTGTFAAAVNYSVGTNPQSVFSADFNGDGMMDLATANLNGNNVSILLGSGTGTFAAAVNYGAGTGPCSVFSADFNGDGKKDLATANLNGNNVSVLLGSGTGTFAAAVNYTTGSRPYSIFSADFNGDGKMDLATANDGSNNVSVLLNNLILPPAAALNFDGTGLGNKVILPSAINTVFSTSNQITVEAWVKPSSLTGYGHIVGNYNAPNNQMQFMIRRQINEYGFWIGNSGSYYALNSTSAPTLNTWEHVAMSYNGSILTAYVNGVVTGTLAVSYTSLGLTTNSLIIGGNNSTNENFSGDIDEVRIWNRALCKSEIVHNMNIELPNGQPGLIAYYKFNQGVENSNNSAITSLADSSGNSYDGTLNNFALSGTTSNWIASGAVTSGSNAAAFVSPTVSISGVNSICYGASTTFTATGNVTSYNWLSGPATATNLVSPTGTTTYSVIGTNSLGCLSNTATITLTVNALPSLVATTNNSLLCTGQTATLSVSGASTYTWSTAENTIDIVVSPTVQTTYTVDGTDANGCSNITTITQNVSLCTGIATLSNNEVLKVYPNPNKGLFAIEVTTASKVTVTNALGQLILTETLEAGKHIMDLRNQTDGLYFIKMNNGYTYKIVKQD